jgi:orotate phosphoribosyltransferase
MYPKEELMKDFSRVGAIVTGSHIVYTPKEEGWFHGEAYVDKDLISMHPKLLGLCTDQMVVSIEEAGLLREIQVIASPAAGAISWGQVLAAQLCRRIVDREILFVFCEKEFKDPKNPAEFEFKFRSGFAKAIKGKKVLIAEDIANPGTSAKKAAKSVIECGGEVIGVSVLCNRSGQEAHDYLAPWPLLAVADANMKKWHEDECPLCPQGIPLNMSLGKAKDWLATEKGQAWAAKYMK